MRKQSIKWAFHYTETENGEYKLYDVKECINPKSTKQAKELMNMLNNDECYTCGYMSLETWNQSYVK
jgi:hypothetical protein